ncbi:MAG: flagellar hook-length control protein FliK [Rhizobacter sp.]
MSAFDSSRSLNALKLKPQAPAVTGVSATGPTQSPGAKDESSKATFSRLLERSRAEATAAKQPPEAAVRSTPSPASPTRASRAVDSRTQDSADKTAEADAPRASATPPRTSAADRSTSTNEAPDRYAEADAAAEGVDAASATDDKAEPIPTAGVANDLVSLLPGGLPPATSATPAAADTGLATSDASVDSKQAAAPLAAFGKAVDGLAGTEASATSASGVKGVPAGFAEPTNAATAADRSPGQVAQAIAPADLKLASDTTSTSGALPNAVLANLAALSVGAGKSEERPRTSTSLDGLPLGSSAAIAGQGPSHLARLIDSPASATATVSTPVGDPGFHEALAAQVSVFARGGLSKAELHLNPAELGPVSVQITMNGDQARVDFGADRAQTRQVIEAGWAELATSLQDAGFTLSGGGVSEQAQRQASQRQAPPQNGRTDRSVVLDEAPVASIVAARPRAGSALDLYA